MASDLNTTTGSITCHRLHKNLLELCLHESLSNGVCSGYFVAACSIWELSAEPCWAKTFIDLAGELPNIFYKPEQLCFVLLVALKAINSIDCINKISILTYKFVTCRFSAPNSRMKASTHVLCCPRVESSHTLSVVRAYHR